MTVADWREIEGWFSEADADAYRALVARFPGGSLIEVGCWKGRSLASVLPTADTLGYRQVVAVDTWLGSASERETYHAEATTRDIFADFADNVLFRWPWVDALRMASVQAAAIVPPGTVDLVFLDAEHTAQAVEADVRAWLPAVRPGGVLAGHDIGWPSVVAGLKAAGLTGWTRAAGCWVYEVPAA